MRRSELELMTKTKLSELARKLDIPGRSALSKDGLIEVLMKAQAKIRRSPFAAGKKTAKKTAQKTAQKTTAQKTVAKVTSKTAVTKTPTKKTGAGKTITPRNVTKKVAPVKMATAVKSSSRQTAKAPARKPVVKKTPAVKTAARKTVATKAPARSETVSRPVKKRPAAKQKPAPRKTGISRVPKPKAQPAAQPVAAPYRQPELPAMPERYDKDYLVLMRRDPYWLYAYWELTSGLLTKQRKRMGRDRESDRLVMRIFIHPGAGRDAEAASFDIDLPEGVDSWYVNAGRPDCNYQAAIGYLGRSGRFYSLLESERVEITGDGVSPITDEEWTNQPETFRRLYEAAIPAGSDPLSQSQNSAEMGLLLRERFKNDWSSGMLASMGSQTLGGHNPDFWFVLDAELIVYGATEPDATVRVQGRPIELRPDGTFSLRFQLPDGTQVIDATAISADTLFRKTITPTVRRKTHATEMIETKV